MRKRNLIVILSLTIGMAISISGCGNDSDSTSSTTSSIAETSSVATEEITSSDQSVKTATTVTSFEEFASINKDSMSARLYEVANDENASTNSDDGVTYMFSKDKNGVRTLGSVIAHYSNTTNLGASDNSSYCDAFINQSFNELSEFLDGAEIHDDSQGYGKIINFSDYSLTIMPDKDLIGITIILSKK